MSESEYEDLWTSEQELREANRTAVLLAATRYNEQIAPFVKDSAARLEYAQAEINRIVSECSAEVGAEADYVSRRLAEIIQLQFGEATSDQKEKGYGGGPTTPPPNYDPAKVNPEPDAVSDVSYHTGPLLEEETREPDEEHDLNSETFDGTNKNNFSSVEKTACDCGCSACKEGRHGECSDSDCDCGHDDDHDKKDSSLKDVPCARCASTLINPVVYLHSPVCASCNDALVRLALGPTGMMPQDPNAMQRCSLCTFTGTQQQVQEHIMNDHPQFIQDQQQQAMQGQLPAYGKQAAPFESELNEDKMAPSPPAPSEDIHNADPTHPPMADGDTRSRFNDVISELANRAAARQFSTPLPEEIQEIASAYGLDPEEVQSNLKVVAVFGNASAINGQVTDDLNTEGMEEVNVEGMGGQVPEHEAVIPLQLAIAKVAEDLGMDNQLVMNELGDSFGGEQVPQEYHASIQGDHRFYLPSHLINNGEPEGSQPLNRKDPNYPPEQLNAV